MKITMYELLGLIKEGKAPKKIKFRNKIYEYKNHIETNFIDYVGIEKETNVKFYLSSYIGNNYINDIFTDEVEIVEEPKKIEKLNTNIINANRYDYDKNKEMTISNITADILSISKAINELIDEINNLKEKKDE